MPNQTFGQWLLLERGNRKAVALAEEAGITPQMWSDLENDRSKRKDGLPTRPTVETCQKIARVLGVDLEEVLRHAGYPTDGDVRAETREPTGDDFPDDDPLTVAYEAFWLGAPEYLKPRILGEVARIVRQDQREQTTHGKRADIERLEDVKDQAVQQLHDDAARMRRDREVRENDRRAG